MLTKRVSRDTAAVLSQALDSARSLWVATISGFSTAHEVTCPSGDVLGSQLRVMYDRSNVYISACRLRAIEEQGRGRLSGITKTGMGARVPLISKTSQMK